MRTDDALLDSLAAFDLAAVALDMRSKSETDRVPDLFSNTELPYGRGFDVTVELARSRIANAERQVVSNAFPTYVAHFNRLLGAVISMLRRVDLDVSDPTNTNTGLSRRLGHLQAHGEVQMHPISVALWDLLVAVRNSCERSLKTDIHDH